MRQKGFIWPFLIFALAIGVMVFAFIFKSDSQSPISSPTPSPVQLEQTQQLIGEPKPSPIPKSNLYNLGVLVIKYFPLTSDGQNIDINITGDVGESYNTIRQRTTSQTNNLKLSLERSTKYLGYKNTSAKSSLSYQIVNTFEYKEKIPFDPSSRKPLYRKILQDHNICDYVNQKNVREVWLWAYQGPNKDDGQPYLAISESKMSGPFGDISNSDLLGDMPGCKYTYRVYTFNYGRGTSEALESWGHQMEAELDAVDQQLFRSLFQGPATPQTIGVTGRCGSVHNPPNARQEYDRENPTPQKSDCLDWNPENQGNLTNISCANWGGCESHGDDTASLRFQVWYWQNLPGLNNKKTYGGKLLRNWWDVHGDFDNVMAKSRRLTLP